MNHHTSACLDAHFAAGCLTGGACSDREILTFAHSLECLEGMFYSCAATGYPLNSALAGFGPEPTSERRHNVDPESHRLPICEVSAATRASLEVCSYLVFKNFLLLATFSCLCRQSSLQWHIVQIASKLASPLQLGSWPPSCCRRR